MKSITMIRTVLAGGVMLALAACSGETPLPETVVCHLGGYRLDDGRTMGLVPRSSGDVRFILVSGETGVFDIGEDGSLATAEGAASGAYRAMLGTCEEPALTLTGPDDDTQQATKLAFDVQETVFDGVDGKRAGRLILPEGGTAETIVVVLHGSERWSGRTGERLQTLLPAYGIGVFAYDKRGTGLSEGDYTQDFHILAGDAELALAEAKRLYGDETVRTGYWGGSQGGWIGPLAASQGGVDFVIAAYGMAEGPLAEDREEVFDDLRRAGYGDDETLAKAREITDATGRVMESDFKDGYEELAAVKKKYKDEPWYAAVEGEFTGQFLSVPGWGLRTIGPWMDMGTSWEYEPVPVIRALEIPQLWILAEEDTIAPSPNTLVILRDLQTEKTMLDIVAFPDTDHGIVRFTEDADGKRTYTQTDPAYYPLIRDWVLTGEPAVTPAGPRVYRGGRPQSLL